MKLKPHISATAFLVNESRNRMVDVSQDIFAKLWVSRETEKLWEDFARHVYPYDDLELSLRNRYFLEWLRDFAKKNKKAVFVNIGAGFTSYPFLLEQPCHAIEVDYKRVMEFKARQVEQWQKKEILPKREIEFIGVDLNEAKDRDCLSQKLRQQISKYPSFVLLEGVSYYLEMAVLRQLLGIFRETQKKGSLLGIEFWKPDIKNHPVFVCLQEYFEKKFGYKKRKYNLFGRAFIEGIDGYEILELTDMTEQEKVYCKTCIMEDHQNILPTDLAMLRRK